MGAPEASGRDKVEVTSSSAQYNLRADQGVHPHTSKNRQDGFQHKQFDAGYGEAPSVSVSPAGPSGGSKFIHPFMMERYTDDSGDTRLRIYGGNLNHTVSTAQIHLTSAPDTGGSGPTYFINMRRQPVIEGITKVDVTGFTALQDDDGNDTVYKAKEYPANQSYGDYYVQWQVDISKTDSFSASFTAVSLFRNATVGGAINDVKIDALEEVDDGTSSMQLRRGTGSGSHHVGTYYAKIGTSYDPDHEDTDSKTIEQVLFNHVYWSPTIVAETE